MKRMHMIIIVVILLLLVGAFIISPFSPLNKVNLNGETVTLPSGYTVKNSTNSELTIANDTNELKIYPIKQEKETIESSVEYYEEQCKENYNVTTTKIDSDKKIFKTMAKSLNSSETITKYWFAIDDTVYNINTFNPVEGTDDVAKDIISSMS